MITFRDDCDKASAFYSERRYQQLRRVLLLMEVLQDFRFGADLPTLTEDVNGASGETWNPRTVHRDLLFLVDAGLVEKFRVGRDNATYRWAGRVQFDRRAAAVLNEPLFDGQPCPAGGRRAA